MNQDIRSAKFLYPSDIRSCPIVIFGSSRGDGQTKDAVNLVLGTQPHSFINLNDYEIEYFSYDGKYKSDIFLKLFSEISNHDQIVFATPIYWYTMSAQMKRFIDRISDILIWQKDLKYKLKDKKVYLITSYGDGKQTTRDCLDFQFKSISSYLLRIHFIIMLNK